MLRFSTVTLGSSEYHKHSLGFVNVRTLPIRLLILASIAMVTPLAAQGFPAPDSEKGHITGTVIDVNNDAVPGASVVLESVLLRNPRTVESGDNGFFEFDDLDPGIYTVSINAKGFANWTSPAIIVNPGQYVILTGSKLNIAKALTTVSVIFSPEQIAVEQVKLQEQQRILGIIPNFYVTYDHNAAPLTTKLKFQLALKTATDPITIVGIGVLAAINQAGDVPNYGQGLKGYGKRFGAAAADSTSDVMIGGAILPSLLHQDPRYFYQGTGTNKSRVFHALSSPLICKGDNGRLQPNYSSVGGDLASAALSNAYYPASNRGAVPLFEGFFIGTGERMLGNVIQEFVLPRLTRKAKNKD
jgi:Carboxypeptidase regulatory-like domain